METDHQSEISGLKMSELVLVLSGLFMLISAGVIAATGTFTVWMAAKVLYAIGLFLLLFGS